MISSHKKKAKDDDNLWRVLQLYWCEITNFEGDMFYSSEMWIISNLLSKLVFSDLEYCDTIYRISKNFDPHAHKTKAPNILRECNNSLALDALILGEIWSILQECRIFQIIARISAPGAKELSHSMQNIRDFGPVHESMQSSLLYKHSTYFAILFQQVSQYA